MKNKIMKILGIALTLAVLIGLLLPAMPSSAGTLNWTESGLPTKFVDGSSITAMGISPDGKTILGYNGRYQNSDNTSGDYNGFVISTDGGLTFSAKNLNDPDETSLFLKSGAPVTQIVFSPKYATDQTIVIIYDGAVYESTDSAKSFDTISDINDGASGITYIDVSYDTNDKLSVVVAADTIIGLYTEKSGTRFNDLSSLNGIADGTTTALAVKFSPNYADDAQILALTNGTKVYLQNIIVENTVLNSTWNDSYKLVSFPDKDDNDVVETDSAFMAFGSNYDANGGKVFVAINITGRPEVWRASMQSGSNTKKATLMNANTEADMATINSISYNSNKLAIGDDADIIVNSKAYSST
jgi:hypothetical protein